MDMSIHVGQYTKSNENNQYVPAYISGVEPKDWNMMHIFKNECKDAND